MLPGGVLKVLARLEDTARPFAMVVEKASFCLLGKKVLLFDNYYDRTPSFFTERQSPPVPKHAEPLFPGADLGR